MAGNTSWRCYISCSVLACVFRNYSSNTKELELSGHMKLILRIGWDEKQFHMRYPLYLDDKVIGFIESKVEEAESAIVLHVIELYEPYQHKGYFPDFLNQIEEDGKKRGLRFVIVKWIKPVEKVDFYLRRGFRRLEPYEHIKFSIPAKSNDGEEVSVIKEI